MFGLPIKAVLPLIIYSFPCIELDNMINADPNARTATVRMIKKGIIMIKHAPII